MISKYKRFIVFAGYLYYPEGGLEDVLFTSDNISETIEWIHDYIEDNDELIWYNILDTSLLQEVSTSDLIELKSSVSQYE